jgi:hypothetical protein
MALLKPRDGTDIDFRVHQEKSDELTLGDPEKFIWSSIKQMCVQEIADEIIYSTHNIKQKSLRKQVIKNIKLYISHACEFYEAAQLAKSNTAPLFYYYSFLNLAKSFCEIKHPNFHKNPESYNHGISWKPNPNYLVDMETESIDLTVRGVWHVLWEVVENQRCEIPNPLHIKVKELFSLCPEIASEYERTYMQSSNLIELYEPELLINNDKEEIWIKFSVERHNLKELRLSRPKFLALISPSGGKYHQVQSDEEDWWTFESEQPKKFNLRNKKLLHEFIYSDIKNINLFTYIAPEGVNYLVPVQTRLPIRFHQLLVLYTLMFWLGSIVRYDPHSVADLQESSFWILIDGFMNQSRIWLLELFEWEFYKTETELLSSR